MSQLQRLVVAHSQMSGQRLVLTHEQHHYLTRVLRLQSGDRFIALDGQGQLWLSQLSADPLNAHLLESLSVQTELPVAVTALVALPKGSGMDEVVRQLTELGVDVIVPVISDRTLLNPSPQKLERWRRIMQEAAEQSERQIVPELRQPIAFSQALTSMEVMQTHRYLCLARGDHPHLLKCLNSVENGEFSLIEKIPSVTIATGPEGGWTLKEIEMAIAAGWQPVSLGKRILRAVTAPLVALSVIASVFERMSTPD